MMANAKIKQQCLQCHCLNLSQAYLGVVVVVSLAILSSDNYKHSISDKIKFPLDID